MDTNMMKLIFFLIFVLFCGGSFKTVFSERSSIWLSFTSLLRKPFRFLIFILLLSFLSLLMVPQLIVGSFFGVKYTFKIRSEIALGRVIKFDNLNMIDIYPSFGKILKHIFYNIPMAGGINFAYMLWKKRYYGGSNIYNLVIERIFIFLLGYSIWYIKMCYKISTSPSIGIDLRKILDKKYRFRVFSEVIRKKIAYILSTYSSEYCDNVVKFKIYSQDGKIIFNPKSHKISSGYKLLNSDFCNAYLKGQGHLKLNTSDCGIGGVVTKNPRPGQQYIILPSNHPSGKRSCMEYNTYTGDDCIREGDFNLRHIMISTGLNDIEFKDQIANEVLFGQFSSECGLVYQDKSEYKVLERSGNMFKNLASSRKKIPDKVRFWSERQANELEKLSEDENYRIDLINKEIRLISERRSGCEYSRDRHLYTWRTSLTPRAINTYDSIRSNLEFKHKDDFTIALRGKLLPIQEVLENPSPSKTGGNPFD